jgi:hypothetical protein
LLFAIEVGELQLVMGQDALAEIVEEFDDGKRLLWRPISRDRERDGERKARS